MNPATWLMIATLAFGCGWSGLAADGPRPGPRAEPETPPPPTVEDWTTHLGGHDPLEGFNRVVYHGANTFIRYLYRPIGVGYATVMPRWGVRHINYFTDNLEFIVRMSSCLMQGRAGDGGIEMLRFLTNTTVGVGGFLEVAEDLHLPRQDEDFGQAFAAWGIGPGCSLYGVNPTNLRDTVGAIFDYALDPKSYVNGGQAFSLLNDGLDSYPQYERIWRESFDPYWAFRELALIRRQLQVINWSPAMIEPDYAMPLPTTSNGEETTVASTQAWRLTGNSWQGAVVDTLRAAKFSPRRNYASAWAYLSPFNTDFEQQGQLRTVAVAAPDEKRPAMPYKFWGQKDATAPLVLVLPGFGAHCCGTMGAAMAELVYDRGCAVAVLANAMNWEFVETSAIERLPGFVPDDAVAVRRALARVLADLRENQALVPRTIAVVGISLGGTHALFVADLERREPTLGVERYLAVNPSVDLLHGTRQLDEFYAIGAQWDEQELTKRLTTGAGHYLAMIAQAQTPVDDQAVEPLPLSEDTAKFLTGYSFRRSLRELLASLHHRQALTALPIPYRWGDRQSLYRKLDQLGFEWYLQQELVPYYAQRRGQAVTAEELNREASLRVIEPTLREHPGIRVIHASDDFLETAADREFLRNALDQKIQFFDHGSHLGNLYLAEVQQTMLQALGLAGPE